MRYGSSELLFNKHSMNDIMFHREQMASEAPSRLNDDLVLNAPTDDLVEQLAEQFCIAIPVLDRDNSEADHSEGPVEVYDSYFSRDYSGGPEGRRTVQGSIVELSVPFTGDKA